jgi:hypothetical protein
MPDLPTVHYVSRKRGKLRELVPEVYFQSYFHQLFPKDHINPNFYFNTRPRFQEEQHEDKEQCEEKA